MEKEYIVTIILGLLVVAIAFGFLTSDLGGDSELEICRQSVIVRDAIPETSIGVLQFTNFKEKYPLDCKTRLIIIDYEDKERATKEVMDTIAECWYMYGNGQYDFIPNYEGLLGRLGSESSCAMCSRIHFTENVKNYYINNPINISEGLNLEMKNQITYKTYLTVNVDEVLQNYYVSVNSIGGDTISKGDKRLSIKLPEIVNVSKGDFFITYRYFTSYNVNEKSKVYHYSDVLFYPWDDGNSLSFLTTDDKKFWERVAEVLTIGSNWNVPPCNHWEEVIPA